MVRLDTRLCTERHMKLTRYLIFMNEVRADETLVGLGAQLNLFRYHDGKWFDAEGEVLADTGLEASLAQTRTRGTSWRTQNSPITFFPIKELNAVVVATFSSPIRSNTRDRVVRRLNACVKAASNAYNATHHGLTGLLNRDAFDHII